MKPSGWIGVLIGLVVFGSIVGHVAAQKKKCYKKAGANSKIDTMSELTKAFTLENYNETCETGESCLQYFPHAVNTGKVIALVECGTDCTGGSTADAKMGVSSSYTCNKCDPATNGSCKDTSVIKTGRNVCINYIDKPPNQADDIVKIQVYCHDACKHGTKTGNIVMGCANDCNTGVGGTCTSDCNTPGACEKLVGAPMCYRAAGDTAKLETVTEIADAYTFSKWNVKCNPTEKCIQHYPIKSDDANKNGKGKVSIHLRCGPATGCDTKLGVGYDCFQCNSRDSSTCKTIDDIKKASIECYEFNADKNSGEIAKLSKIYCIDKCQFLETGKNIKVGCAVDVKGTDCPATDLLCAKMIDKNTSGGGGGGDSGGGGGGGGSGTTKTPKNSNKLTNSACLIGSTAILLFATTKYMRLF